MAIRLITAVYNKGVDTVRNNNFFTETPCSIHYNRWLPPRVAESTNRHITLHKRTD